MYMIQIYSLVMIAMLWHAAYVLLNVELCVLRRSIFCFVAVHHILYTCMSGCIFTTVGHVML